MVRQMRHFYLFSHEVRLRVLPELANSSLAYQDFQSLFPKKGNVVMLLVSFMSVLYSILLAHSMLKSFIKNNIKYDWFSLLMWYIKCIYDFVYLFREWD